MAYSRGKRGGASDWTFTNFAIFADTLSGLSFGVGAWVRLENMETDHLGKKVTTTIKDGWGGARLVVGIVKSPYD